MSFRDYHESFGTTVTIDGVSVDVTATQRLRGDRAIISVTRDDTKEQLRLSAETLQSIKRQGIEGHGRALSELEKALINHDWNYEFGSGDSWFRGQQEWREILTMCSQLPEADVRAAWAKYGHGPYPFEERKTA